jgi:hypothetical protein
MHIDTLRAWPWVLTGLQVLGPWAAGRGLRFGWLLGGTVQLPWIAYALLTNQIGFIRGASCRRASSSTATPRRWRRARKW